MSLGNLNKLTYMSQKKKKKIVPTQPTYNKLNINFFLYD